MLSLLVPSMLLLSVFSDEEDREDLQEVYERAWLLQKPSLFIAWFQDSEEDLAGHTIRRIVEGMIMPARSLDDLLAPLQWMEELVSAWNDRWARIKGHRGIVLESYSLVAPAKELFPPMEAFAKMADDLKGENWRGILDARFPASAVHLPRCGGDDAYPIISINMLMDEIFSEITRLAKPGEVWSVRARRRVFDDLEEKVGAEFGHFFSNSEIFPVYSFDETRVLLRRIDSSTQSSTIRRAGHWLILPRPEASEVFDTYFANPEE